MRIIPVVVLLIAAGIPPASAQGTPAPAPEAPSFAMDHGNAAAAAAAKLAAECAEKLKKEICIDHFVACDAAGGNALPGRVSGQGRCTSCLDYCTSNGIWPAAIYSWTGQRLPCPG